VIPCNADDHGCTAGEDGTMCPKCQARYDADAAYYGAEYRRSSRCLVCGDHAFGGGAICRRDECLEQSLRDAGRGHLVRA